MTVDEKNSGKSNNDSFDINEIAYLDEDITPEFIEKLQMEVAKSASKLNGRQDGKLDVNMFEEVQAQQEPVASEAKELTEKQTEIPEAKTEDAKTEELQEDVNSDLTSVDEAQVLNQTQTEKVEDTLESSTGKDIEINKNIDDNFIKKYKAKLNKKPQEKEDTDFELRDRSNPAFAQKDSEENDKSIEDLSQGKITEREISQSQVDYNESLEYTDDNIKYSKYIIYIEPENTEFMDSLTVKERKNLINKILREQGNLILARKTADFVKSVIKHLFVAIITIAVMIPVVYKIFNFSLESTIDNYRRSESNFQTLYKEHGKIKQGY